MHKNIFSLKQEIVAIGRRVYERGYVASNDGNISIRIDDERILITPTGVSKGFLKPEDMAIIDYEGNLVSGTAKASSERFMHISIYKERSDINAVCHAHPPYATGFAVAGIPLDQCVLPEVIVSLGSIPIADYGLPGTDELFKPIAKHIKDHDAFLLENHGATTIGHDVLNAYHKMETLEHFAHILFVAKSLGRVNELGQKDVQDLVALREKFGITSGASCNIGAQNQTSSSSQDQPAYTNTNNIDKEDLVQKITDAVLKRLNS